MRLNTLGGLWIDRDEGATQPAVRPRRLALLAVLAAAGPRGVSRERVLSVLWPESPPDKARHALSQTLYSLRQDLGTDVILASAAELRLDPDRITSDVADFRASLAAREWARAAGLYAGPFLDGFYLAGASQFERWAEEERGVLERDAMRALERAASEAGAGGRVGEALPFWERLARLDPLSGRFAVGHMEALLALGRRDEALAHGEEYARRVQSELDTSPDESVTRLLARARDPVSPAAGPATTATVSSDHGAVARPEPATSATDAPPRRRPRRRAVLVAAAVAAGAALLVVASRAIGRGSPPPVLAVGMVRDLVTPDSAQLGGVLSEMLATSLGRLTSLQVIANSRILQLVPRGGDTLPGARTEAARRAGATQVLEGELTPVGGGALHLSLRRVDLRRGVVLRGYQVSGPDRLALFDSATTLLAADLGVAPPITSLGEVTTRSPIAFRLYEEGLRAFFQFDVYAANRLFHAAIVEDSTFALAMYYAWRSEEAIGGPRQAELADRALALSRRASDRARLLILAHVGLARSDPRAVAAADTLATRFPNDPEALTRAAAVADDLGRATTLLNRAVAIDSAASIDPRAVCRVCDALDALATRYADADSLAAVERTYARWSRLRPGDYAPWRALGDVLLGDGRLAAADAAFRRADSLGAPRDEPEVVRLERRLRADDLDGANATCRARLEAATDAELPRYRRPCLIALRMQGRYRDALALARSGRAPGSGVVRRDIPADSEHEAILDFEMGRPQIAADELARQAADAANASGALGGTAPGRVAWLLTLSGTASDAAWDSIRVRALVDSVAALGARSLDPRDQRLHHFLRGLLLARARQHEGAVRAFRSAMSSPVRGYTRINLELARSLVALGRPAEAVPVLRAALHGGFGESAIWVTRTDLHEALGNAFAAAGATDSAAVHYERVLRAWRSADPVLAPRRDAISQWLTRHGRPAA